jgi:hypothetical protein
MLVPRQRRWTRNALDRAADLLKLVTELSNMTIDPARPRVLNNTQKIKPQAKTARPSTQSFNQI